MWTYNYTNELYHHGTKGMKWGQRLYQRKDGSLTALGRMRYRKMLAERAKAKTQEVDTETVEQKKARIMSSHSAKEIYKNKDLFTDKEIQDAYNRLNNEKNIKSLIPEELSKGQKFMKTYVDTTKTIKQIVDSADDAYKAYVKGKTLLESLGVLEKAKK